MSLDSYGVFADYYDKLTGNVDYSAYAERIDRLCLSHRKKRGIVVDLGCGTANLTALLAKRGYHVIGVDKSCDMLAVADAKLRKLGVKAKLYCQDMTKFRLVRKTDAAISTLDGLNHLASAGEVRAVFLRVHRFLKRGGLFIFDMNTVYKHKKILANNCFIYDTDEVYLGWQNEYRAKEKDNSVRITLDFFVPNGDGEKASRYTECFSERAYPVTKILSMLIRSGLVPIGVYDGIGESLPKVNSERVLFVAKKIF